MANLSTILESLWQQTGRRKVWVFWMLGLLMGIVVDGPAIVARPFLANLVDQIPLSTMTNWEEMLLLLLDFLIRFPEMQNLILRYTFIISGILIVAWIVGTIGQGALIAAVDFETDRPFEPKTHWQSGRQALWRLVLIDAALFFPVFLILLTVLMGINGGLYILIRDLSGDAQVDSAGQLTALFLCLIPLLCLTFPLSLVTVVYRVLAYRFAVIEGTLTRPSIRLAHREIRSRGGHWLFIFLFTMIFWGVFGGISRLGTTLSFLPVSGTLEILADVLISLWQLGVASLKYLTISAFWTLAFKAKITP